MSAPNDAAPESGDRDATRYGPTPSADPAATHYTDPPTDSDPAATRYSDTPADPHATVYPLIPPPTTPLLPAIEGYEILGELGKGGMGVVYKARQFTPERLVALKLIRAGQLADEEDVRLFRKEANEAARLDHPNIVPVYEVGEQDGLHFFTMKLIEGGSLNQRLDRYRNDPKAVARLVTTAARAVHYAHQRQLLHRDLKPGNILLDAAGQPHVADFGLAKRLDGESVASQSGAVAGTPEYMAPEQARGEKHLTTAADVYALGGVLYTLLTGRPPFRDPGGAGMVLVKVLTEEPTPLSKVRSGVPRDLETICLKCLQKEPARRYGSAEAVAEDLERWLKGEPVRGRPVGRMERVRLWCRRNPAVAGLLTAFIIALLAGVAVSTYFAVESSNKSEQLGKANELLEDTLARSLLRPLGQQPKTISDPEIEALWDLARSNERVRLLFAVKALQQPDHARQLRNRADLAVHAAVGLDPVLRRRVEEAVLARLRDEQGDLDTRTSCVLIGATLEDWSPGYPGIAASQAIKAMPETEDSNALQALAEVVVALAPRLDSAEASADAYLAIEAITKTDDSHLIQNLVKVTAALVLRLDEAEKTKVATQAVDTLSRKFDHLDLGEESKAFTALATWVEPAEAPIAARLAVGSRNGRRYVNVDALAALAPRLTREAASDTLRHVMSNKFENRVRLLLLAAKVLPSLAPALGPKEASQQASVFAQQVADAMAEEMAVGGVSYSLRGLAEVLALLAPQLDPSEASQKLSAAARQVVDAMSRKEYIENPSVQTKLAETLALLALQLDPAVAAAYANEALTAMGPISKHYDLQEEAKAVKKLGPFLEPADASKIAHRAVNGMGTANDYLTFELAEALAALAPRLSFTDASAIGSKVVDAMARPIDPGDPGTLPALAEALAALAPRLDARVAQAGVRQALVAMKTNNAWTLSTLAKAVAALAQRLDPAEALPASHEAMLRVMDAMARPTEYGALRGLATLDIMRALAEALAALAPLVAPSEAGQLSFTAARLDVDAISDEQSASVQALLTPGSLTAQQLVDLLKMPLCCHEARQVIVRQLGVKCGQSFANQWEFIEWAQKHRPDLDLTSPPTRP